MFHFIFPVWDMDFYGIIQHSNCLLWYEWNRVESRVTKQIDYLVIAGDTPAEIKENYMELTGKAPLIRYGLGFWQCKLRYQTQEELLQVARRYYRKRFR